jgi:hypothetical protein
MSAAAKASRRELSRRYKEAPPPMGVYAIRNKLTRRVLVGASANPEGAMNRIRFELKLRQHRNAALQQDWSAHGEAGFSFAVIDSVKKSDDPAFDRVAELAALLDMWRQELCVGELDYDACPPVAA